MQPYHSKGLNVQIRIHSDLSLDFMIASFCYQLMLILVQINQEDAGKKTSERYEDNTPENHQSATFPF